ncbi:hypothetical protein TNCV_2574511 [Trichonephila clavipes]|nr:hypothetical protein TNCV_2574511 [Trichonephila clavipes]
MKFKRKALNGAWKKLYPPLPIIEIQAESVSELEEIGNVIIEIVVLARQINLEVDSDKVQKLLDSHNLELALEELIKEQEQGIEELESLDQGYSIFFPA